MFRVIISTKSSNKNQASECIDTSSTGISFYDDFLDPKEEKYLREQKNLQGHIEMMTPQEYYKACSEKVFKSSVDRLKAERRADDDSIEYLTNALESGKKFHLPYVNYATHGQEGLHRMMVLADKYGWDNVSFPVLVVEYVDGALEEIKSAKKALRRAVQESMQYAYSESDSVNEFISQVQWELEKYDEDTLYHAVLLTQNSTYFWVSLKGFRNIKEAVQKSELRYRDESEEDDFDIDEALLEMSSEELLRHFNL